MRATKSDPPDSAFPEDLKRKLASVGEERLQDLDDAGIRLQILSYGPTRNSPPFNVCRKVNEEIANAVKESKGRLGGFAILPMSDPASAAQEPSRCVEQLGFFGALINNRVDGQFLDDEKYWPVFQKAQELDVPMYLHPNFVSQYAFHSFIGNYPTAVAHSLAGWAWGWHSDTGLHVLRLYASGPFDKFHRLKVVIGHDGDMLPFQLDRILPMSRAWGPRERTLREVWHNNIWVTTSGMFSAVPFEGLRRTIPISYVLFSVDYPYAANTDGTYFMNALRGSSILSEEELELVALKNAETLLKIKR